MRIIKCDICKKTMTDKNKSGSLEIFYNEKQNYGSFELCNVCSQSIVAILKDKKMIKIKDKKDEK